MTPDSEPTRGKEERLVFLAAESLCAKCEKAMYHNDETSFKFEPGDICNDCAQSEVIHLRTERDTFQKVVVERDGEILRLKGELDALLGQCRTEGMSPDELEMDRAELLRRYRNHKAWFQVWASCLDGLNLSGLDSHRMPSDVRLIVERLQAELSVLKKRDEWVDVKERLPENERVVIFYEARFKDTHLGGYNFSEETWVTYDEGSRIDKSEVTHWREIPPAPKSLL